MTVCAAFEERNWQMKPSVLGEKTQSLCHVIHHNPTWTGLGLNTDIHHERPATNRLNQGTVHKVRLWLIINTE